MKIALYILNVTITYPPGEKQWVTLDVNRKTVIAYLLLATITHERHDSILGIATFLIIEYLITE